MTQYSIFSTETGNDMGLKAVTYPIKIARIDIYNDIEGEALGVDLELHTGSTLSGGSSLTIIPMRDGSPSATASARVGSLSYSGVTQTLTNLVISATSTGQLGFSTSVGQSSIQPVLDLVIEPNTVFSIAGFVNGQSGATVYFEELRI